MKQRAMRTMRIVGKTTLLAAMILLLLAQVALADITRGEIITRAFSARKTPYSQSLSVHYKSYQPDEHKDEATGWDDEPYIDCSGLVQKAWQVPQEIYPGNWNTSQNDPGSEYNVLAFRADSAYWEADVSHSGMQFGDALSYDFPGDDHIVLYVYTDTDGSYYIIDASGSGSANKVEYRDWPSGYPSQSTWMRTYRKNLNADPGTYILDNTTAKQVGGSVSYNVDGCSPCGKFWDWTKSTSRPSYMGKDYQYQYGTGTGTEKKLRYGPRFMATGSYAVYMHWPDNWSYGDNVKIIVRHQGGTSTLFVDETQSYTWYYLGTFTFNNGFDPVNQCVIISTYGTSTSSPVVGDTVKFNLL